MGLVTLVGLVTITLSVYMITWSHKLYTFCEPLLGMFERRTAFRELEEDSPSGLRGTYDFIILGLGRYGCRIGQGLRARGFRLLGIDFDPEALRRWRAMGMDAHFGDATDPEFVAHLPLSGVKGVISAVPRSRGPLTEADGHAALLHALKGAGFGREVAVTVNQMDDGDAYRLLGATLILAPFDDAAEGAVRKIVHEGDEDEYRPGNSP